MRLDEEYSQVHRSASIYNTITPTWSMKKNNVIRHLLIYFPFPPPVT